jgi:homopolymeric O-antigen transport system ATP-binding protein
MSKPIIQIENIGKAYHLGQTDVAHAMFRDALVDMLSTPFRRLTDPSQWSRNQDLFWALRNISFDVQQGDVVGIIGRNGAGKSTLLKILSRITEPTEGQVTLRGRIASLLEVGTGFHPELTGRENIYLNGALLGMSKIEITRRFDEIVAFAEIEKFLDTPVKRYSSGMYVRLAFSVAAHLEPEILIVDEVLAVGDAEFQRKCLGRMEKVTKEGRTILFVSHNIAAVKSLCGTGVLLNEGHLHAIGPSLDVVEQYVSGRASQGRANATFSRPSDVPIWMTAARILCDGEPSFTLPMGADLALQVDFAADPPTMHPRIGFVISGADGSRLICANNRYQPSVALTRRCERGTALCRLGQVPLMPGGYTVSLYLGDQTRDTHIEEEALAYTVVERDIWGLGRLPPEGATPMWWPTKFELQALMRPIT